MVAAAWVLLLCATVLLTSGALYGDAVALGGLRAAMDDAPPADRAVVIESAIRPGDVAAVDAAVRGELERLLTTTGGEAARITRSPSFAEPDAGSREAPTLTEFASYEAIDRHATLLDGRWAEAGATPQEATLSEGAAATLGLAVGDRITLVSRRQASLEFDILVTGIWRPDPADPYWLDPDLELTGSMVRGSFTTAGPFVIPAEDLVERGFADQLAVEWRAFLDPAGFQVDVLGAVRTATEQLNTRVVVAVPDGVQVRVSTGLAGILATVERAALVSRTGVLLLVIQFAVLAAYAIILVAGMLADRRRAETALLRSRGASSGHLAAMALFEAGILTALAAVIAPFVALAVVRWLGSSGPLAASGVVQTIGLSNDALIVDGITAAACVAALTIPMLGGGPNLAGVRAAIARQAGRTLAQRLGLDLALVAVAAIGLWQLRLYGAPLTRNARGVLGVDPLLVAAPGIGLLAGAVIATRLIPRVAELGQSLLERRRGLVAPMGGRGLARRPLRYTRSALLLMLAAALGTFAAAHVATWTRSQADQAAYQAGAPVRIDPSQQAPAARSLGGLLRAVPGVAAAMPVDRLRVDAGRGVRGGPVVAVDAATAATILNATPDADGAAVPGLLETLAAERPSAVGAALADGTARLAVVVDAAFENTFHEPTHTPGDLAEFDGVRISVVVEDGDGRLWRLSSLDTAVLDGEGQRLAIDLATTRGAEPTMTGPLRLRGVEVTLSAPFGVGVTGALDIVAVEASRRPTGDDWERLTFAGGDPGWSWLTRSFVGNVPYVPPSGAPWRILVDAGVEAIDPFRVAGTIVVLTSDPASVPVLAAIASRGFLDATGARVGDTVQVTLNGARQAIRVAGSVETFPSVDPGEPFLVVDAPTLAIARFAGAGGVHDPEEWWLSATDDIAAASAILAGVDPGAAIVTTSGLTEAFSTDPVPLGVIGVLGLGSAAALIFASIGFVVSATVSTRERLGEFALLRALGLSGRQLSVWLSLENAFLLGIGITAGVGLGLLLAWLVLPFSTLTSSGEVAVPTPLVVVPWTTLAPILGVAAGVFVATLVVLRRQLLGVRIGDVLRGRDE